MAFIYLLRRLKENSFSALEKRVEGGVPRTMKTKKKLTKHSSIRALKQKSERKPRYSTAWTTHWHGNQDSERDWAHTGSIENARLPAPQAFSSAKEVRAVPYVF